MEDLEKYVINHRMCMILATKYMQGMLNQEIARQKANPATDLSLELEKYRDRTDVVGQITGRMWLTWFLDKRVPEMLKEEEDESKR